MWIFIFLILNLVCRWQNTRAWINQACDISSPPKRLPGRLPREMDMFDNKEIFEYLPFHLPIFDRESLKMQVMQVMTIENPGFPSLIAQLSIPSIRSIEEILQILTWNGKKWKLRKKEKMRRDVKLVFGTKVPAKSSYTLPFCDGDSHEYFTTKIGQK